jgi:uncharacterized protein (DUF2062 family)
MFQRRTKRSFIGKVRGFFWPHMGWKRAGIYYWHRLQRIPGTSSSIAAGFAIGVGMAFSPFYGTHIVTAALIALAIRGSAFAAAIGAQLANPWTAPPMWFAVYYAGAWMLGRDVAAEPPNFVKMFKDLTEATLELDWRLFVDSVWSVFWPMTLGAIPLGILTGTAAYFILEPIIARVQHRRLVKLRTRRAAQHSPHTGV